MIKYIVERILSAVAPKRTKVYLLFIKRNVITYERTLISLYSLICKILVRKAGQMIDIAAVMPGDQVLDHLTERSRLVTADIIQLLIHASDIDGRDIRTKQYFFESLPGLFAE